MTITKQDILDSFKAYHADSNLTYTDMTKLEEVLQAILSINVSGGSGGDASSTNQLLQLTELEEINTKIPDLVGGKIPVDVASLSVTVDNAQLEISNDVGNPIPISGTVTANTGLSQPLTDTQLRAIAVPVSLSSLPTLPTGSNTIGAISNTSFGISGSLPAFASTPTFNIGTAPNLTITNSSFTANAGTNLNTSLLALETGGNLASINNKLNSQIVSSSTVTTVNAVASDTTLLASNANRKGFIIFNNSTAILYVLLATGTSSSTNFSVLLNQGETLIIDNTCLYTGIIKGIWASATGDCKVTEFT